MAKETLTYMERATAGAKDYVEQTIDTTPIAIPVTHQVPETSTQIMSKILLGSGVITREQWEAMNGLSYDVVTEGDFDDSAFSEIDDEFSQSSYASYEDVAVPDVDSNATIEAKADSKIEPSQEPSAEGSIAAAQDVDKGGDNEATK